VPCQPGQFCVGGVAAPCPAGVYGATPALQSSMCSGPCSAGYFCPANSTAATQVPCGSVTVFCPARSGLPQVAAAGKYTVGPSNATRNDSAPCPGGSYCIGGVQFLCEAGSFGCADRLSVSTCNGPCTSGYYCPAGSTSSLAHACGGNATHPDAASWYCPQGSPVAVRVGPGNYSSGSPEDAPHVRTGQSVCPPGHYCVGGVLVRVMCALAPAPVNHAFCVCVWLIAFTLPAPLCCWPVPWADCLRLGTLRQGISGDVARLHGPVLAWVSVPGRVHHSRRRRVPCGLLL
jgi:hypothetical protein